MERPTSAPAAMGLGHLGRRFDPCHVGGEAGHRDAVLQPAHQVHQCVAHLRLGTGIPIHHGVCGIADHGQHGFVGEVAQRPLVEVVADQGFGVQLPIAGVQNGPGGGTDNQGVGFRDRMGQGNQLDLERAERKTARKRDFDDFDLILDPGLHQLRVHHGLGKSRGIDWTAQARPQVADRANVILVGVGQDQPRQIRASLLDKGGVRHQHIDPRHGGVGEGDAQVHHQPRAGVAIEIQVHPDLAGPAEGQEI